MVERIVIALLANGNILLEGLPGLAKTRAIKSLSKNLAPDFSRIQFTPDLLPSDVTDGEILLGDGTFEFRKGPVFGNLILAEGCDSGLLRRHLAHVYDGRRATNSSEQREIIAQAMQWVVPGLPGRRRNHVFRRLSVARVARTASTRCVVASAGSPGASAAIPSRVGGLGIGVSKLTAACSVYGLHNLDDLAGVYAQLRAGWALGDHGKGRLWLQNAKGVTLRLAARRRGLQLALGAAGVVIGFKR